MNAISSPVERLSYVPPPVYEAPFADCGFDEYPKSTVKERLMVAIRSGLTRSKARRHPVSAERYYGPHLSDVPKMREEILRIMANPRVVQQLRDKGSTEIPKDILNLIANQ
jgi:hypothetical protein